MRNFTSVSFALVASLVVGCQSLELGENESALSGATFTTLVDGSRVDANIYDFKEDVYLDGGPGIDAPSTAAALPAGDYYFQVTDPSGQVLLSTDAIGDREFTVNADGLVISTSSHDTGVDLDHGGITVQLMPYLDTPNNGGEYKMWITPVSAYTGVDGGGAFHGFVPRYSKTDNYKVRFVTPPPLCPNGYVDPGEECDDGNTTGGDGCDAECQFEPKAPCCGDGYEDPGEECDDGNTTSGDGCSAECTIETEPCCGDGNQDPGEECDDGNTDNGDGCSAYCTIEPPC